LSVQAEHPEVMVAASRTELLGSPPISIRPALGGAIDDDMSPHCASARAEKMLADLEIISPRLHRTPAVSSGGG
jgi:hypothetical protein